MAEDKFRLPKSSYEELAKIIKGYALFDKPIGLQDVSRQTSINPTVISSNVGFMLDIGILQGGRDKQCTPNGRDLAQALMHEMPDEIRRLWRAVVRESDFLSRVLSAVKIRNGMDEATASSHIAYSAGQKKSPSVMTGARSIVDILRAAELLREEDGKLTAVDVKTIDVSSTASPTLPAEPALTETVAVAKKSGTSVAHALPPQPLQPGITISVSVNVECSPSDLDGLGDSLKRLMRELCQEDNRNTDDVAEGEI